MNIQAFYEYVILRDILAYILPGGISLAGIAIVIQAYGSDHWNKLLPFSLDANSVFSSIVFVLIAFLFGHILDMAYRVLLQGRDWFRRPKTIRRLLTGNTKPCAEISTDPVTQGMRQAIGQFFNLNWDKVPVGEWISSGKAYEANVALAYWVEYEDPRLLTLKLDAL